MTITLIAIIIYFIFVLAFFIFSLFGVYHLWQFGYAGDLSKPVAIIYIIIAAVIIFFTLFLVLLGYLGS